MKQSSNQPPINKNKRRAILGATVSVTAASIWHKPIINAVILPTHAQTSPPAIVTNFMGGNAQLVTQTDSSLLDLIIPQAYAGNSVSTDEWQVEANYVSEGNYDITVMQGDSNQRDSYDDELEESKVGINYYSRWTGSLVVGTSSNLAYDGCERGSDQSGEIISVSESSMVFQFANGKITFNLTPGDLVLPGLDCQNLA